MSPAEMLVRGLRLPPPESPPVPVPPGTRCPLTGAVLTEGHPIHQIVPDTTGEWLDLLRGQTHGYFSATGAAAIRGDWNLGNRAVFLHPDGRFEAMYPLLARPKPGAPPAEDLDPAEVTGKKAKTYFRDHGLPRPCWSDVFHELPRRAGQTCLLIVAADPKKRVWNRARVGPVGRRTPVLVFDTSRNLLRVVDVDADDFDHLLEVVETAYAAGFTKRGISGCLLAESKAVAQIGMDRAMRMERELAERRTGDAFDLAVLVAQRPAPPETVTTTPAPQPTPTPAKAAATTQPLGGLFDAA
jgi:hypothetical protein